MRTYVIYCYTNKITGKKYVGQTCTSLDERAGRNGSGYQMCTMFWRAIQKYGWENFSVEVFEEGLTLEEANEREEYWIEELNTIVPNGYNLQPGGGNHKVHESSRQKMSENRKGKYTVKNRSYESKRVFQYTKNMEFVAEYPSVKEASRQTGIGAGNIGSCCNGKAYSAGNYIWRYPDNLFEVPMIAQEFAKTHSIVQMTLDGEIIAEYVSTAEAARQIGCYAACIRRCLIGKAKTFRNFTWKYKEVA